MTVKDVLVQAREVIADPVHWTKRIYARDAEDNEISIGNPNAVKFCAVGAILRVDYLYLMAKGLHSTTRIERKVLDDAEDLLSLCVPGADERNFKSITAYNDNPETTHADVLAVYDTAIARSVS